MNKSFNNKGFTLVELAVSLVVIGLLIGLGTAMVGPLMTATKVRETKETIGGVVESVNSWASGNNSLPSVAGFDSAVKTPLDSWGRRFVYLYDSNLAPGTATKDTICGRRTTSITLETKDPAATIQNVAFVIISQGEDSQTVAPSVFTTLDGVAVTTSAALSTPPNPRAIIVPANTDDIVRWVTLDELRTKVGCQGAQLRIVNNELPYGYINSPYSAVISADGGYRTGTTYKWCIETAQNVFQTAGGLTLNGVAGGAGTNPAGVSTDCSSAPPVSTQSLTIGGTPVSTANATSELTIYVWDDNSNTAKKKNVLTINPEK